MLAGWAGIAIDNARNYENSERRREGLERMVRQLEATTEIARAVGGETDLDRVLELIVSRWPGPDRGGRNRHPAARDRGMVVAAKLERSRAGFRDPLGLAAAGGVRPCSCSVASRSERWSYSANSAPPRTTRRSRPSAPAQRPRSRPPDGRGEPAARSHRRRREGTDRWGRHLHDDTLQGLGGLRMPRSRRRAATMTSACGVVRDTLGRIDEEIDGSRGLSANCGPPPSTSSGSRRRSKVGDARHHTGDRSLRRRQAPPGMLFA